MKKFGFIIFAAALSVGLLFSANCGGIGSMKSFSGIKGSGTSKSEQRNISGFSKIEAGGAMNVEITAQGDFSVTVEADDNLLQYIKTETSGDTLKIYSEGRISPKAKMNVKITMPEVKGLDVSGASNAVVSNVKVDSLELNASGASKIKIEGESKDLDSDASGASKIDAENLRVENAKVKASGASSSIVSPSNELKADASGASSIHYTGEPKNVNQKSSGASSVKKK